MLVRALQFARYAADAPILGRQAQGKTCDAIEGIVAEGEEIVEENQDKRALDAGIIASAQAVAHYEITRYGTLKRWAETLGMQDAAELIDQNLAEETDALLTDLADAAVNRKAE